MRHDPTGGPKSVYFIGAHGVKHGNPLWEYEHRVPDWALNCLLATGLETDEYVEGF